MSAQVLEIPVSQLPFEAGSGFSAKVTENGIAHIVIHSSSDDQDAKKNSMADFLDFVKAIPKKNVITEEDKKDTRYIELLKKHSPEYLKEHAPELLD